MAGNHHHSTLSNLKIAFFLNLGFTVFEIIGGLYVNSVAIISDAVHDLGDSLSLGTAWFLQRKSSKQADNNFSYGYSRFSLLGALITGIVLLVGSGFVIREAVIRIIHPEPTDAAGMALFAIVGVIVNGYAAWKLSKGTSMNEKMVSWHLIEDVLGWVAVLIAAIVLLIWDLPWLDPALSLGVCAFVLWNVAKRLRKTMYIFLQGVPGRIELPELVSQVSELDHVDSLHLTHAWSLDGNENVFTTHLKLKEPVTEDQLVLLRTKLRDLLTRYRISHSTIEIERHNDTCMLLAKNGGNCLH